MNVALITHILIALSSVGHATYVMFSPSKVKLQISYVLVGLTLASGTYLVLSTHAPMLQSCETGLIYVGMVSFGLGFANRRLAAQRTSE